MDNTIQSDLIRGHINTIILKSLFEGDKYGYEIMKEISERSLGQYNLKQPTLYSSLKRLEKQGLIRPYWSTAQTGGGRRKYYTLTVVGRDICAKNLAEWEYSRTLIDSLISNKPYDMNRPAPDGISGNLLKSVYKPVKVTAAEHSEEDDSMNEEENKSFDDGEEQPAVIRREDEEDELPFDTETAAHSPENVSGKQTEPAENPEAGQPSPSFESTLAEADAENEAFSDSEKAAAQKAIQEAADSSASKINAFRPFTPVTENRSYSQYITSEQYNLFSNMNVDIDRNIREYEQVDKIYNEKNTNGLADEADREDEGTHYTSDFTRDTSEIEEKLDRIVQENRVEDAEAAAHRVGFSAEGSSFVEQAAGSDPTPQERELEQKMNELKQFRKKQAEEADKLALKAAILNEYRRDETKAEREYKILLSKLLSLANSSRIDSNLLSPETVSIRSEQRQDPLPAEAPKQNIKLYEEDEPVSSEENRKIVDFTEIQSRMQREGFRIRTRETETAAAQQSGNYIKTGNLILHTLLIVFAIAAAEVTAVYLLLGAYFNLNLTAYISLISSLALLPIVGICCYLYYKPKNIFDKYRPAFALCTSTIFAGLAFVVCCGVAFICGVNLSISQNLMTFIVLPAVLAVNIPLGVLIYTGLHRSKRYKK